MALVGLSVIQKDLRELENGDRGALCSCFCPISWISELAGAELAFGMRHVPVIVDVLVRVFVYEETQDNCHFVRVYGLFSSILFPRT